MAYADFEMFVESMNFLPDVDFDAVVSTAEDGVYSCEFGAEIPDEFDGALDDAKAAPGVPGTAKWYKEVYDRSRREADRLIREGLGLAPFDEADPEEALAQGDVSNGYDRAMRREFGSVAEYAATALAETVRDRVWEALSACLTAYAAAKLATESGVCVADDFREPVGRELFVLIAKIANTDYEGAILGSALAGAVEDASEETDA